MARIKRFAALMLIGILALGILTGCSEDSIPTTPPEAIGQLFVDRVKATVEEVSNDLEEGDSLYYTTSHQKRAESTLKAINDDGTIQGDASGSNPKQEFFYIFTEDNDDSTAKKLTMENMKDFVTYIRDMIAEREKGHPITGIGVYYRVIGNDVYAAVCTYAPTATLEFSYSLL